MQRRTLLLVVMTCSMLALPPVPRAAEAAPASKAATRAAAAMSRAIKVRLQRIARLDREAHRRAVTRVLSAPRTVFRYVSEPQARKALAVGFGRMTHFTTRAVRGRPLTRVHAQQRYGLAATPDRRLTVTLPQGTPVKSAKVHGGAPGVGELVNTQPLPRSAVTIRSRVLKP